jgi:hypothetical protein
MILAFMSSRLIGAKIAKPSEQAGLVTDLPLSILYSSESFLVLKNAIFLLAIVARK